jgi:hypothetical protein
MIHFSARIGALLATLCALAWPAMAASGPHAHHDPALFWGLALFTGIAGAVTVTYAFVPNGTTVPVSGTVAPTAAQAALLNSITATVNYPDGDTTATLTHNWGFTANDVSANKPWINWYIQNTQGTGIPVFNISNTNAVVMTKSSGTGTGSTFIVILQRPHSIIT